MNIKEINEIIAKYDNIHSNYYEKLGFEEYDFENDVFSFWKYTDSIDRLVPIWVRMGVEPSFVKTRDYYECLLEGNGLLTNLDWEEGKTMHVAAARATAKAIIIEGLVL